MNLNNYKTMIFDCDGVVLNSNMVKTQAFYNIALPYGEKAAQALVDYHVKHGGISRYKKFSYFLSDIVSQGYQQNTLEFLLNAFSHEVKKGLLSCQVAVGIKELRERMRHSKWVIVSGGDQFELRDVFAKRELTGFFDGGIFGSPDTKEDILERALRDDIVMLPAVYLGDSQYDYEVANRAGLDFIFISDWSEFKNWRVFFNKLNVQTIPNINSLNGYISCRTLRPIILVTEE